MALHLSKSRLRVGDLAIMAISEVYQILRVY